MKTSEAPSSKNVAPQKSLPQIEGPQDAVRQESPLQDAVPQESALQNLVPQESSHQDALPQESSLENAVPQESPIQDAVPPESLLQDAEPQEPPLQDSWPQEEPSNQLLADTRLDQTRVRMDDMPRESASPSESRPMSSSIVHFSKNMEEKKRRLQEVCTRLKLREIEQEQSLKNERKSSQRLTEESDGGSPMKQEEDEIEEQSTKSSASSFSIPSEIKIPSTTVKDAVEFDLKSDKSTESDSIEEREEPSEDIMRTAVVELSFVPSLSALSLSDDIRSIMSSRSIKTMKSMKSIKSLKSLKSTKSDVLDPDTESESLDSESEDSLGSRMDSKPQTLESQKLCESGTPSVRGSDIIEISFEEFKIQSGSKEFEAFFTANNRGMSQNAQEISKSVDTNRIIGDFINMLIRIAVGDIDPVQFSRNQLDKDKLIAGLVARVNDHLEVKGYNDGLNDGLVEYCRRTKNSRAYSVLSKPAMQSYYNRYRASLDFLAYGRQRVALVKEKMGKLITMSQLELCNAYHNSIGTEQHFENTVRHVLVKPDSATDLLQRVVNRELRLMSDHRSEISNTRYLLIMRQHDLGKLKEEIRQLETLSEDVSMSDFIGLHNKIISFEKKLDERNSELKKIRSQYHTELHLTRHNREKVLALKNRHNSLAEQLIEKNIVRKKLKGNLYDAKMQRKHVRARINDMAYNGGILSMPSLMYDYDRTVAHIRNKQERIAGMKETVRSLSQHLSTLCMEKPTKSI